MADAPSIVTAVQACPADRRYRSHDGPFGGRQRARHLDAMAVTTVLVNLLNVSFIDASDVGAPNRLKNRAERVLRLPRPGAPESIAWASKPADSGCLAEPRMRR